MIMTTISCARVHRDKREGQQQDYANINLSAIKHLDIGGMYE